MSTTATVNTSNNGVSSPSLPALLPLAPGGEGCPEDALEHFSDPVVGRAVLATDPAVISRLKGLSRGECADWCIAYGETTCVAFQYKEDNAYCELLHLETLPTELISNKVSLTWEVYTKDLSCTKPKQVQDCSEHTPFGLLMFQDDNTELLPNRGTGLQTEADAIINQVNAVLYTSGSINPGFSTITCASGDPGVLWVTVHIAGDSNWAACSLALNLLAEAFNNEERVFVLNNQPFPVTSFVLMPCERDDPRLGAGDALTVSGSEGMGGVSTNSVPPPAIGGSVVAPNNATAPPNLHAGDDTFNAVNHDADAGENDVEQSSLTELGSNLNSSTVENSAKSNLQLKSNILVGGVAITVLLLLIFILWGWTRIRKATLPPSHQRTARHPAYETIAEVQTNNLSAPIIRGGGLHTRLHIRSSTAENDHTTPSETGTDESTREIASPTWSAMFAGQLSGRLQDERRENRTHDIAMATQQRRPTNRQLPVLPLPPSDHQRARNGPSFFDSIFESDIAAAIEASSDKILDLRGGDGDQSSSNGGGSGGYRLNATALSPEFRTGTVVPEPAYATASIYRAEPNEQDALEEEVEEEEEEDIFKVRSAFAFSNMAETLQHRPVKKGTDAGRRHEYMLAGNADTNGGGDVADNHTSNPTVTDPSATAAASHLYRPSKSTGVRFGGMSGLNARLPSNPNRLTNTLAFASVGNAGYSVIGGMDLGEDSQDFDNLDALEDVYESEEDEEEFDGDTIGREGGV